MQRLGYVAGPRLAQQALAITQVSLVMSQNGSANQDGLRQRKVAIRHVLDHGTIYEPILDAHKDRDPEEVAW